MEIKLFDFNIAVWRELKQQILRTGDAKDGFHLVPHVRGRKATDGDVKMRHVLGSNPTFL